MPDQFTGLADLHLPESAAETVVQESIRRSRIFGSGAMVNISNIAPPAPSGGTVTVPFWSVPNADSQIMHSGDRNEVRKITGGAQISPVLNRLQSFGAEDLAIVLSGEDPVQGVLNRIAEVWGPDIDRVAIAVLLGFSASARSGASMAGNMLDISGASGAAAYLDADAAVDTCALLGEDADSLAFAIMHPNTVAWLKKQNLIATVMPSEGGAPINIYQEKRVISTNQNTVTGSGGDRVYRTTFIGAGALAFGEAPAKRPVSNFRDELQSGGEEAIVSRRHFYVHPFGAAWDPADGVPAKSSPSNAELAGAANWKRVYEGQNVRIATCVHKVG